MIPAVQDEVSLMGSLPVLDLLKRKDKKRTQIQKKSQRVNHKI